MTDFEITKQMLDKVNANYVLDSDQKIIYLGSTIWYFEEDDSLSYIEEEEC